MKKLSMEQKAKAYDEALEKAKSKIKNDKDHVLFEDDVIEIFPELKESEDETTRNYFIKLFKEWLIDGKIDPLSKTSTIRLLAYLEKQGEQKLDGTFVNVDDVREDFVNEVYRVLDADPNNDRANQIIDAFDNLPTIAIEKQGEQKPIKVPKFKDGDWVIDKQGIVHQIERVVENVTNHTFGYDLVGGGYFNDATEGVRLWTIQDAKDGDMLETKDAVFIFKHIDKTGLSLCKSYCEVIGNSNLGFGFDFSINGICPATKEQRDQLERAITNAGYEWDAEKKELKKIEQKPADRGCNIKEEDMTPFQKYVFGIIDLGVEQDRGLKQVCDELLSLAANEINQKPVEWSEEDEKMLKMAITSCEQCGNEYAYYWLKSLKDRYTWKPSDEQITWLYRATDEAKKDSRMKQFLNELLSDLKKLKE